MNVSMEEHGFGGRVDGGHAGGVLYHGQEPQHGSLRGASSVTIGGHGVRTDAAFGLTGDPNVNGAIHKSNVPKGNNNKGNGSGHQEKTKLVLEPTNEAQQQARLLEGKMRDPVSTLSGHASDVGARPANSTKLSLSLPRSRSLDPDGSRLDMDTNSITYSSSHHHQRRSGAYAVQSHSHSTGSSTDPPATGSFGDDDTHEVEVDADSSVAPLRSHASHYNPHDSTSRKSSRTQLTIPEDERLSFPPPPPCIPCLNSTDGNGEGEEDTSSYVWGADSTSYLGTVHVPHPPPLASVAESELTGDAEIGLATIEALREATPTPPPPPPEPETKPEAPKLLVEFHCCQSTSSSSIFPFRTQLEPASRAFPSDLAPYISSRKWRQLISATSNLATRHYRIGTAFIATSYVVTLATIIFVTVCVTTNVMAIAMTVGVTAVLLAFALAFYIWGWATRGILLQQELIELIEAAVPQMGGIADIVYHGRTALYERKLQQIQAQRGPTSSLDSTTHASHLPQGLWFALELVCETQVRPSSASASASATSNSLALAVEKSLYTHRQEQQQQRESDVEHGDKGLAVEVIHDEEADGDDHPDDNTGAEWTA